MKQSKIDFSSSSGSNALACAFGEIIVIQSLERLREMVAQFNSLPPKDDAQRGKILAILFGTTLVRMVRYNKGDFFIVPERLIHADLAGEQLSVAANQHTVNGTFPSIDLTRKISAAEIAAASDKTLPDMKLGENRYKYIRKYPDNPRLKCKIERDRHGEYHFIITGQCFSLHHNKRKMNIAVSEILQISLLELGHLPDFDEYVDLQIIT